MEEIGWYGFDLDATIAKYDGWKGDFHIGEPILPMIKTIKKFIEEGKKVKIVTARWHGGEEIEKIIQKWTLEHIGHALEVTAHKDYAMIALYDDRAITVMKNDGKTILTIIDEINSILLYDEYSPDKKIEEIGKLTIPVLRQFSDIWWY